MPEQVMLSICVPAYKNTVYLERLLQSVELQTFQDFEVVVTDDSPDDSVQRYLQARHCNFTLRHIRNVPALGTPENWNEGIRQARGKWIKIMHDDDWFTASDALSRFALAIQKYPEIPFFFAAYQNITEGSGQVEKVRLSAVSKFLLGRSPLYLFRKVYVGNPSCTLVRADVGLYYDRSFKHVVDFEYYIRLLRKVERFHYIDEVLLNIGFNDLQVTRYTFGIAAVQIPENISMLQKMGTHILRNIVVYDYYWRMFRNLGVRNMDDVRAHYDGHIPAPLVRMVKQQSLVPLSILKVGLISKPLMVLSYVATFFMRSATA